MSYFNKTEEQEFNDFKKWFKQNGTPIVAAVVIAIVASFGWTFWKNHQIQQAQQASTEYQAVMENYLQNPEKNQPLVDKFISDKSGTSYAVFAQLEEAKQAVKQANFEQAKTLLKQALATSDATLKNVIYFRLATLDLQTKQYDEALNQLGQITDDAWLLRKQLLSADILAAKGDKEAARSAYQQARENATPEGQMLIDVKLNNL